MLVYWATFRRGIFAKFFPMSLLGGFFRFEYAGILAYLGGHFTKFSLNCLCPQNGLCPLYGGSISGHSSAMLQ